MFVIYGLKVPFIIAKKTFDRKESRAVLVVEDEVVVVNLYAKAEEKRVKITGFCVCLFV